MCHSLTSISPLISIFTHLIKSAQRPQEVHFLYATKASPELDRAQILFLTRLMDLIAAEASHTVTLSLFLTGTGQEGRIEHGQLPNRTFARRMTTADAVHAIDGYGAHISGNRSQTLCYVCGPPRMTDEFVGVLSQQPEMAPERVLCEKWW